MRNLILFVLTMLGYGFLVYTYVWEPHTIEGWITFGVVLGVLCAPFHKDGNVYTILGNAVSEKNSYAILPLLQNAKENSYAAISFFQNAEKEAFSFINLGIQAGRKRALTVLGITLLQFSEKRAEFCLGFVLVQNSYETAEFGFGVVVIQDARYSSGIFAGLAFLQMTRDGSAEMVPFGCVLFQKGKYCEVDIGMVAVQVARENAEVGYALAILQRVPGNTQVFSVNSQLVKKETADKGIHTNQVEL